MGPERETWMTELPPELSARIGGGQVSQTSVRAFNQRGKTGRGDTSGWTDTPEQRKAKEAQVGRVWGGPTSRRSGPGSCALFLAGSLSAILMFCNCCSACRRYWRRQATPMSAPSLLRALMGEQSPGPVLGRLPGGPLQRLRPWMLSMPRATGRRA